MKPGVLSLRQVCAVLCTGLVIVFMQAAVASAVASVQHMVAGHGEHNHMLFADVVLDFHHHDDADDDDHDGHHGHSDAAPAHSPGHHHHNGDLGSASFVLVTMVTPLPEQAVSTDAPVPDRFLVDIRHSLPERPPRTGFMSV